ncbi:uncharacterized protein yc1106_07674 [Curvularia clavata]|uniref:Uncharacterized protein n=1 Tax=Curvularia clavata TaxID=95742 RepID=A0A9Q8ZDU9_CURCL|nr:uncharacterized protein yc1106_07674 [Curvularia clavata]
MKFAPHPFAAISHDSQHITFNPSLHKYTVNVAIDNRKPPVANFDYNNVTVKKEDDFFRGFGIDDADTKTDLKARRAAAFRKINPDLVTY